MTIQQYKDARRIMMKLRGEQRKLHKLDADTKRIKVSGYRLTKTDSEKVRKNAKREMLKNIKALEEELEQL